jgi:uncharacterized membrane protein HdeD (DUF308 family)
MWNHKNILIGVDDKVFDKLKKYSKIGGILFLVLGLIGIIFPSFMTFSTVVFVSYLMLFAGLSSGWMTWISNKEDWAGWLKSFLLVGISLFMLFYPLQGVATLGLLFSIYFFMDAFAGFGLAFSAQGSQHKWLWIFNAAMSLLLAVVFMVGWPFSSIWLVGFFVGVSLFFDGIALLMGSTVLGELEKEKKDELKN